MVARQTATIPNNSDDRADDGPSRGKRAVKETQRRSEWLVAHRFEQIQIAVGRSTVTKFRHVAALGAILMTAPATVAHAQQGSEPKSFPERHPDPPQVIRMI